MAIDTLFRNDYTGDGSTADYDFLFQVFAASHLKVIVTDGDGNETTLVLGTHYSVTFDGALPSTGAIALLSGSWLDGDGNLDSGFTMSIERVPPFEQSVVFANQAQLNRAVIEGAVDRAVMLSRRALSIAERAVRLQEGLNLGPYTLVLPKPEAGKVLGWDAIGQTLKNHDTTAVTFEGDDSDIVFRQAGVDAVDRTVRAKLRDVVSVKDFGAIGDGVTDDTAAVQAAFDSGAGCVRFPRGVYRQTATWTIQVGVLLIGEGAGPGGNTAAGDNAHKGVVIDHDFDGECFLITGVNAAVNSGLGSGIENMLLRQISGNGSGVKGIAIKVIGASDTFSPSWFRLRNVTTEVGSGKDDWTWGIYLDGSAKTGADAGGGLRDMWIENVRTQSGANATGGIFGTNLANCFIMNTFANGAKGIISITAPAGKLSSGIKLAGVQADTLALDRVQLLGDHGGQYTTLTTTSATTICNLNLNYLSNLPTFNATNSLLIVGNVATTSKTAMWSTGGGFEIHSQALHWKAGVDGILGTLDAFDFFLKANGVNLLQLTSPGTAYGFVKALAAFARNPVTLTYGANVAINARTGNIFHLIVTNNSNFQIDNPTNAVDGDEIVLYIRNAVGGAMGTITWDTLYAVGSWTNPANANSREIRFLYVGAAGKWRQQWTGDTPN